MNDYEKQGTDFLEKTGTEMEVKRLGHFPYFDNDDKPRDVYQITLTRNGRKWSFRFGQSIANSRTDARVRAMQDMTLQEKQKEKAKIKPPSAYDVLAGITKDDPETFEDFCSNYGYDTDSRKAEKIYFAVQKEYKEIYRMFNDVMDELQEIQ